MKKYSIYLHVIAAAVTVFVLDLLLADKPDGSVLIALLFWAGIGQGIIALTAAADLSKGKWIENIRPYMQQYYPLLLLFPLIFLVYARHVSVYNWSSGDFHMAWLTPTFFIVRNVVALLLPFIFAHFYVQSVKKASPKTGFFAVMYIVFFVVSQSFMAFDMVMTFEYPWINTLMGGYFFVEALFAGIAFSAVLAGLLMLKDSEKFKKAYRDFVVMIMGFALLWAGLFYSQYLVIWYGNIPEEVSYVAKRMAVPSLKYMGLYVLIALFVIPFLALVSRKIKSSFPAVTIIALFVFSGLIVERLIYMIPVANMTFLTVVLPLLIMGIPFIYTLIIQKKAPVMGTE